MELSLAILTGLLAGGFFWGTTARRFARARKRAGPLLWKAPWRLGRWQTFAGGAMLLSALGLALFWTWLLVFTSSLLYVPGASFMAFINVFVVSELLALAVLHGTTLEVRQHGLVFTPGLFVPWRQVGYCKRTTRKDMISIWLSSRTITRTKLAPEQIESLLAVLSPYVELRDPWGKVLNPDRPPADDPGPPSPRRWQFSLRSLFLFTILAAVASAWLGVHMHERWDEEAALAELEPFAPVVDTSSGRAHGLDFSKSAKRPGDAEMEVVGRLGRLRSLNLADCPITDAGLAELKDLRRLHILNLSGTGVTDAGLEHLLDLESLEYLDLSDTRITDSGLECLARLESLESITLLETDLTAAGVQRLQEALPEANIFQTPRMPPAPPVPPMPPPPERPPTFEPMAPEPPPPTLRPPMPPVLLPVPPFFPPVPFGPVGVP